MLADRDVFARCEFVIAEAIASLVVIGVAVDIVVERPVSARLPHKVPDLVGLVLPEAPHAAAVAMLLPLIGIEMPGIVSGPTNSYPCRLLPSGCSLSLASSNLIFFSDIALSPVGKISEIPRLAPSYRAGCPG